MMFMYYININYTSIDTNKIFFLKILSSRVLRSSYGSKIIIDQIYQEVVVYQMYQQQQQASVYFQFRPFLLLEITVASGERGELHIVEIWSGVLHDCIQETGCGILPIEVVVVDVILVLVDVFFFFLRLRLCLRLFFLPPPMILATAAGTQSYPLQLII